MRVLLITLIATTAAVASAQDIWPMKAHDVRRTGQSAINGPSRIIEANSWSTVIQAADKINVGATVTQNGAYFGSWGLQRRAPNGQDQRFWDKADGQVFGLNINDGSWRFGGPVNLDLNPRCYAFGDRGPNPFWCGLHQFEVSYYNGTVEGQAAYDADRRQLYFGRGDGKLYAVDEQSGEVTWRFVTFNPQNREDPDGGGEIVTAPLLSNSSIFFGTWGEGNYETNAFYSINRNGRMNWRWPANTSLEHRFFASPATSPDERTVYASTFTGENGNAPASLYAFNSGPRRQTGNPLKWEMELSHNNRAVFTTTLAVGGDGIIYIGGNTARGFGTVAVIAAIRDRGSNQPPEYVWEDHWRELNDGAQFTHGIALRETQGQTRHLFVTTANLGTVIFNNKPDGELHSLDLESGEILASYDPSDDTPTAVGSLTSPAIGRNGTIYYGVRGRFGNDPRNGHVQAVRYDDQAHRFSLVWDYEVDGHIEWNHPAIGPDGGIYIGSTTNDFDGADLRIYDWDEVPPSTNGTFYGLRGPRRRTQ